MNTDLPEIKVILLGDTIVGKTCMLMRYMKDEINDFHVATIGIESYTKVLDIKYTKDKVKLSIIDTSGQERYMSITKNYYKQADGVLLMYDITNKNSFKNLENWFEEIEKNKNGYIHIYLIGNKNDLEHDREVSKQEGENFAREHDCKFFETSILKDKNVKKLFVQLAEDICKSKKLLEYSILGEEDNQSYRIVKKNGKGGCC